MESKLLHTITDIAINDGKVSMLDQAKWHSDFVMVGFIMKTHIYFSSGSLARRLVQFHFWSLFHIFDRDI